MAGGRRRRFGATTAVAVVSLFAAFSGPGPAAAITGGAAQPTGTAPPATEQPPAGEAGLATVVVRADDPRSVSASGISADAGAPVAGAPVHDRWIIRVPAGQVGKALAKLRDQRGCCRPRSWGGPSRLTSLHTRRHVLRGPVPGGELSGRHGHPGLSPDDRRTAGVGDHPRRPAVRKAGDCGNPRQRRGRLPCRSCRQDRRSAHRLRMRAAGSDVGQHRRLRPRHPRDGPGCGGHGQRHRDRQPRVGREGGRVQGSDDAGEGNTADVATAVYEATDAGDRVINMSLAGPRAPRTPSTAVPAPTRRRPCSTRSARVVVVAAAGNNYSDEPVYPGGVPRGPLGGREPTTRVWSSHSQNGGAANIAAPGLNIVSTWHDGGYADDSGTSMATAMVSAAAALTDRSRPVR